MSARIPLQHGFEPLEIAVVDKGIAPFHLFAATVQRCDGITPFFAVDGVPVQKNRCAADGSDGALGIALVRVVLVRGLGFAAHGGLADTADLGGAIGGNGGLRAAVLFQQREHVGDGQGNLLLQTAGCRVIGAVHGVSDGKGLAWFGCGCRLLCVKQPTASWVINGRNFDDNG